MPDNNLAPRHFLPLSIQHNGPEAIRLFSKNLPTADEFPDKPKADKFENQPTADEFPDKPIADGFAN